MKKLRIKTTIIPYRSTKFRAKYSLTRRGAGKIKKMVKFSSHTQNIKGAATGFFGSLPNL